MRSTINIRTVMQLQAKQRLFEKNNFFGVYSLVSHLQPFCTFAKYLYTGWEEGQIGVDFHGEVAHLRC